MKRQGNADQTLLKSKQANSVEGDVKEMPEAKNDCHWDQESTGLTACLLFRP